MWEQIRANRRRSSMLIFLMGFLLIAVGCAFGGALVGDVQGFWVGALVAAFVWGIQMLIYAAAGESILLSGLGARELTREDCPRLFNLVEEMKLASGLEYLPSIYLIDDPSPNAFALGRNPKSSVIAVTSGLLYRLDRDELQGVIAHEVSHLKNQDTQFMTLAGVMLGSIVVLSELTWRTLRYGGGRQRSRSSSRGGGQLQLILFLLALVVALIGPFVAQLLYFACSRSREYLADACACQYTRYPEGLASALEKIAASGAGLSYVSKAVAPMFVINPLAADGGREESWMSTHPSTTDRIHILRAMAGASLADYDQAYRRAKGGRGVIGAQSLESAPRQAKRQASGEGPVLERPESRSTVSRLHGYVELECGCGMKIRVPESYEQNQVRCIRCSSVLALPQASRPAQSAPEPQDAEPLRYVRQSRGWETFRCGCGASIQLSPSFCAPRMKCPRCSRMIEVGSQEATV